MIQPDMATMLAFLFTDATPARRACCRRCWREANESSFNAITVDGDTSTSDTVLLFATGQARHAGAGAARRPAARRLPRGARRGHDRSRPAGRARRRGRAEADRRSRSRGAVERRTRRAGSPSASPTRRWSRPRSPAADANWGRLAMAIGKAGEPIEPRAGRDPGRRPCDRRGRPSPAALRRGAGRGPPQGPGDPARGRRSAPVPAPPRSGPAT